LQGEQDEIQQAPHGPGLSMSSAPAGGGEPGIGSRRRPPATLVIARKLLTFTYPEPFDRT
jgi:hypothetical protein